MIQIPGLPQPRFQPTAGGASSARDAAGSASFGDLLARALSEVENAQAQSAAATTRLVAGEVTDLAQVMLASEKATLALQLTLAVRNKVLEAYQELMRMPL